MKNLLLILSCSILLINNSANAYTEIKKSNNENYFMARITFYTDCPRYGKKTASGKIAKEGYTVAAEKKIPFGTLYNIPSLKNIIKTDGMFQVQDRGSAVDKRTASKNKYPVIDVYVSSHEKINILKKIKNNIVKVYY
jgi:rare lipoprotein A (peptidoglycan hydrolase)